MIDVKELTLKELEELVVSLGEPPYRARQIMAWIYHRGMTTFEDMTDLKLSSRKRLGEVALISRLKAEAIYASEDGTRKYLFRLHDESRIESVLIPEERRLTACLSVQVGCPLGCRFCLTGYIGYGRDLSTAEMVNQLLAMRDDLGGARRISNIVFMGMGEPLLNIDRLLKAIELLTHDLGLGYSARRITVSTVGLIPEMRQLGEKSRVNLAVSLHATTEEVRRGIVPITRRYSLRALIEACRSYPLPKGRMLTFEYLLLKGVNDSDDDAFRLVKLLKGIRAKVNLILFNEFPEAPFQRPEEERVARFQRILLDHNLTATVRASRGRDIYGACGQLGCLPPGSMARSAKRVGEDHG